MHPRERRLIRRLMLVASALVALMLAATVWTVLQSRGPAMGPAGGSSPARSAPASGSGGEAP
jgi:hypothetical protein